MRTFLNPVIHTIFVMLGPRCNLKCRYCLQRPLLGGNPERQRAGERHLADVISFIRDIARNQTEPVIAHFYGGEPFLYEQEMREIVEALAGEPNLSFSTISNGTLLTPALADWLNARQIHCAISWDGPRTRETRGVDVFADPERRDLILGLNSLSLSAVISAYNYPLESLDALIPLDTAYAERHGQSLFLNFDEIMDTGLADRSLLLTDCDRVRREMTLVAAETRKLLLHETPGNPWRAHLGLQYLHRLKGGVEGRKSLARGICACGNGYSVLNVDLNGNLYRCHNVDTVVGTIHDTFMSYLDRVTLHDPTRANFTRCLDCPVVALCRGGCPLIGWDAREASYCRLKRAVFSPFIELAMSMA